jgi:tetratricopeptide (TPR) repeat protein
MTDFFFISYSSTDGQEFAIKLADELASSGIAVWMDTRLRPGEDWDEQVVEAIRSCRGMIFVMTADSVRQGSVCKHEWVRALKYKKPVIPVRLHSDAELPFRLGSREYVRFDGPFDFAVARLRKHLTWMDSPEGELQAIKDRLSDAERELPRAEAEQQARIRDDIAELKGQIGERERIIANPKAAEDRVQKSIKAGLEGERRCANPAGGTTSGKFINPPPLIAPTWFQNRHVETRQIGEFLKDESLRLMTVAGRGGVGKTAMVCRLLRSLECGQLPDEGGALAVDAVVYLSSARSFHRTTFPDLYASLTKLLPDDAVKQLDAIYKNPQATARATMEALAQAFPGGRTVVLLDNFEDMLSVETGRIKDAELEEALRALLEIPPHGIKVIITTRVLPGELALVQPGLQRRLDLDAGLERPYGENILKAMDADGKAGLRDAPDALLSRARERTLGYPRALEHLFGILASDRDTSLEQILDDTGKFLPERVVAVLVGEAFCRLDVTAQRVMQALATYRYPAPPAAVDYLLQPHVPGINSATVLSRLVNMQFVHRDAGRYYLHQVDRDYALSRIEEGDPRDRNQEVPPLSRFGLRHRAAEWFKLSRKPKGAWKTLDDLGAQLSEFELRCECGDYDTAAELLLEFDYEYLHLWGHYQLMVELHERLQGRITDTVIAGSSAGNLGTAYWRMGKVRQGMGLCEEALRLARERADRPGEGVWLSNLANCVSDLGQNASAIEYYKQALAIRREVGDLRGESSDLSNIANRYTEIGQNKNAVDYYLRALNIDREIRNREGEATDLYNLGGCYDDLGQLEEARTCLAKAIDIARSINYRLVEAASHNGIGKLHTVQKNWNDGAREYQRAIEMADAIGHAQFSKSAREGLALLNVYRDHVAEARDLVEAALTYDILKANHGTLALQGLVAIRQGDRTTAREAFHAAIEDASELIAVTPDRYTALDSKGFCLCGLALCGETGLIEAAKAAYGAARAITSDAGIVEAALQEFDALAEADTDGILAGVRVIAAGRKTGAGGVS